MKILITGPYPYWNQVAIELLAAEGIKAELFQPAGLTGWLKWTLSFGWRRFDYIYHVCGRPIPAMLFFLTLIRRPLILHWIGTDVHAKLHGKPFRFGLERLYDRIVASAALHLSDSPDLLAELEQFGVDARVVRLLPRRIEAQIQPLPKDFTVLSYWQESRKLFYRGDWVFQLAGQFPAVRFLIALAKGTGQDDIPANVKFLGPVEKMEELYAQSSVLIRLPVHDSISAMVLEMLARGRYVIYNKHLAGCSYAEDYDQLRQQFTGIMGKTGPNTEGAEFVKKEFSFGQQAANLRTFIGDLQKQLPERQL